MKKVLLHIGAHKSASTMLQHFFSINSSVLASNEKLAYFGPAEVAAYSLGLHFRRLSKRLLNDQGVYQESINQARAALCELAGRAGDSDLLISWEGFMGHSSLDVYGGLYTAIEKIADSLSLIFSGFNLRVLFVVRRQDRFIESCYLQQVKEGRTIAFLDFCSQISPSKLSWLELADCISAHIGPESLCVIPFELIEFAGHERFSLECLVALIGREVDVSIYKHDGEGRNQGISAVGVELALKMLPLFDDAEKKRKIAKYLFHEFSSSKYGRPDLLGIFERRLVLNCCARGNLALFHHYIPDYATSTDKAVKDVCQYWSANEH